MYSIKPGALESILLACRNVHPDEFFSMLGGKGKVIDELVLVQAEFGDGFSSWRQDLVPFDKTIIGTVHSHPNGNAMPSRTDIRSFRGLGEIHLIAGYPYTLNNLNAFDNTGKITGIKVV